MKTLNNVIVVHRNETFTMDKIIQNKDGTPYIVSKELSNPYWLITVSDTRYDQKDRYLHNWWLSLANYQRFKYTNPVNLLSFTIDAKGTTPAFTSFDAINSLAQFTGTYFNGLQIAEVLPDDFVFYLEDTTGIKVYKYWSENAWQNYECRIIKQFSQETTRDWIEQSYVYSINLMAGIDTKTYLQSLCSSLHIEYFISYTKEQLYQLLLNNGYEFSEDFNLNSPLAILSVVKPILIPTELRVMSNINGGFYG